MADETPEHGALLVFGSGPGIGRNVAGLFAEKGFKRVILLSRDKARLSEDVKFVQAAAKDAGVEASVDGLPIDLSDVAKTKETLENLDKLLEFFKVDLECILYNAARVGQSKLFEFDSDSLETDLRISVISLYEVAQWALPKLEQTAIADESKHPAFLVTSGGLYKNPFPAFFALAAGKAAQYNLVHSLHKEYNSKDVHCACIVVEGRVSDDAEVTTARKIAEEAWKLFEQPRGEGELDVQIQDPGYLDFIKKNA